MNRYRLGDLFCIRLTGVPLEVLDSFATPDLSAQARDVLSAQDRLERAADAAARGLREMGLARSAEQRLRRALRSRRPIADDAPGMEPLLAPYGEALSAWAVASASFEEQIAPRVEDSLGEMWRQAVAVLPDFLVFESESALEELRRRAGRDGAGARRPMERNKSRHFALYLQRVCAKSDTFGAFGPVGWGRVVDGEGLALAPRPGIAAHDVQIERWVGQCLVDAMNADPEVRPELAPRLHPNGAIDGDRFARGDTGDEVSLSPAEADLLARCDGRTPAHALGEMESLAALAARGAILWHVEVPAYSVPVPALSADVAGWRDGPVKQRWKARLVELTGLAAAFAASRDPVERQRITGRVRELAGSLGGAAPDRAGRLYAATNPLVEGCSRECGFAIGRAPVDQLMRDAAPWFDLWWDSFGFAASHAYRGLRPLFASAPRTRGVLSLAGFLAHCERQGLDLRRDGLARLASEAFAVIKADLLAAVAGRDDAPEWILRPDECRIVRARHDFPPVAESVWPSADLQLCASSPEAIGRGDYQWVVSELHAAPVILQRCFYWSCPDRPLLHESLRGFSGGRPRVLHSRQASDAPVHVVAEAFMDALPASFAAPERPRPGWSCVSPARAVVVDDEAAGDLRVQDERGQDLGSLTRSLALSFGMHPFFPLALPRHTPRLRLGNVVVQRESWRVRWDELGLEGRRALSATGAQLLAVERMRADRGVPRRVYIRPVGESLERVALFAREKDVKPVYVDLESCPSIELFLHRMQKFGEVELSEMLPGPEEQIWREADGTYTFELRTIVAPAGEDR